MLKLIVAVILGFTFAANAQTERFVRTDRKDVRVGKFASRAIVRIPRAAGKNPVVIMLPGSGPSGPESMALPEKTLDGKLQPLFDQLAEPFNRAGAITIQLGKPGVEFFEPFGERFYNQKMYLGLQWTDLIANVSEAVEMALRIPGVDAERIYLLGHSEGTQVAVDYAAIDSRIKGLILLSYTGLDPFSLLTWQYTVAPVEFLLAPDVDANKDKFVTKEELEKWPEVKWVFAPGQTRVSLDEMQRQLRNDPERRAAFNRWIQAPIYQQILRRGPVFEKTAKLPQDLFIFTGALDVQTHPREALAVSSECKRLRKKNCAVVIVPDLGHGFSVPKGERKQKYLDATMGPIDPRFQSLMYKLATDIF